MQNLPIEIVDRIIRFIPINYRVPLKFIKFFCIYSRVKYCGPNIKILQWAARTVNLSLLLWLKELRYPLSRITGYLAKNQQWKFLDEECELLNFQAFKYLLIYRNFALYAKKIREPKLSQSKNYRDIMRELVNPKYIDPGYFGLVTDLIGEDIDSVLGDIYESGNLPLLKRLNIVPNTIDHRIIKSGNVELLQYVKSPGQLGSNIMHYAILFNHVELAEYLYKLNIPVTLQFMQGWKITLPMLQWLESKGVNPDLKVILSSNNLSVLEYYQQKLVPSADTLNLAITVKAWKSVEFLRTLEFPTDTDTGKIAVKYGDLDTLKWLYMRKYPFTEELYQIVVQRRDWKIIRRFSWYYILIPDNQ